MSVEGFTCLLVFKNLFSFGLTFKGFDWLVQTNSTKNMFIALGSVQVAICALTIPMCKFSTLALSMTYRARSGEMAWMAG
jgi:hypothetical protein